MYAKLPFSILLLGLLLIPGGAEAQPRLRVTPVAGRTLYPTKLPPAFTIRAAGAGDLVVHDGEIRDAFTAGALLGIHFGNEWEIEGLFSRTRTAVESGSLTGGELEGISYMYGGHVNYHIPAGDVTPYVSIGAGGESWEYNLEDAEIDNHWMFSAGGGVDVPVAEFFSIRLDARDCVSRARSVEGDTRSMHHLMLMTGITFLIPTR